MATLEPSGLYVSSWEELVFFALSAYLAGQYPAFQSRQQEAQARLADRKDGIPAKNDEEVEKERETTARMKQDDQEWKAWLETKTQETVGKVGRDPSRPYDPIFNKSQDDLDRERTSWREDQRKRERERYAEYWDDAIKRIKAGEFASQRRLSDYYQKSALWGQNLVKMMLKHEVFTTTELDQLFSKDNRKRISAETRTTRERDVARIHSLTRDDWEQICRDVRPYPITLEILINDYLKARRFNSPTGLAAFVGKPQEYGQGFKLFVLREGLMTEWEFEGYFAKKCGRPRNTPRPAGEVRAYRAPRRPRNSELLAKHSSSTAAASSAKLVVEKYSFTFN